MTSIAVERADTFTKVAGWNEPNHEFLGRLATIQQKCDGVQHETTPHIGRLLSLWDWVSMEWALDQKGLVSAWQQGSWIVVPSLDNVVPSLDNAASTCGSSYCCAGWGLHLLGLTDREVRFLADECSEELLTQIADSFLGISEDHDMYAGTNGISVIKECIEGFTGLVLPDPDADELFAKHETLRTARNLVST